MVGELDPKKGSFLEVYSSSDIILLIKVLVPSNRTTCHLIYDYVSAFTGKFYFVNHVDCRQLDINSNHATINVAISLAFK